MKQFLRSVIVILMTTFFIVYSSGLLITVHHCCHCKAHHHSANDHRHCHEETYFFKITDNYEVSDTHFNGESLSAITLFTENFTIIAEFFHFFNIIKYADHFPPPHLLENLSISLIISQFLL
ncbi:MAG: hypothetical protein MJZ72_07505 [Bacteroidales bacterium]|nr:hypothetical protein [Bacteroidales bacterium]